MTLHLDINWKPFPKERPRSRKNSIAVYTPSSTKIAERELQQLFLEAVGPEWVPIEGPIAVELTFFDEHLQMSIRPTDKHQSKLRGDLDNYAKTALDALNGVAFVDDRYVERLTLIKR